jgi:hypothetical protein
MKEEGGVQRVSIRDLNWSSFKIVIADKTNHTGKDSQGLP